MAELTGKKREALPDSAFAVVSREDGKKVRKYPVSDEAHMKAALSMSHGGRSGKPAPAAEHKAVHAAVGRRDKALLDAHMKEHHGKGMMKRAWEGIVATFPSGLPRLAKGATVAPDYPMPHGKWILVDRQAKKVLVTADDREAAVKAALAEMERDPAALEHLQIMQSFGARDLVQEAITNRTYR